LPAHDTRFSLGVLVGLAVLTRARRSLQTTARYVGATMAVSMILGLNAMVRAGPI